MLSEPGRRLIGETLRSNENVVDEVMTISFVLRDVDGGRSVVKRGGGWL